MNGYIVTLANGAKVEIYSSSWMRAGAEACAEYRKKNPEANGVLVTDVVPIPNGGTDDILIIGGDE